MPSKAEFTLSSNFSSMKAAEQPLVVLCGWINSKPKHVQKYADVFHGLGCATISSILPTAAGYSPFEYNARKYTERLLNFIEESMANDSEAQKIETCVADPRLSWRRRCCVTPFSTIAGHARL